MFFYPFLYGNMMLYHFIKNTSSVYSNFVSIDENAFSLAMYDLERPVTINQENK